MDNLKQHSRRSFAHLLSALGAVTAVSGQGATATSHAYRFEDLEARQNGPNVSRKVLNGATHTGFAIEVHETELAPGQSPHAPHHHDFEEILVVYEGTVDYTVAGRTTVLGPGGVAYAASNDEHGLRNNSNTRARYAVVELGRTT